VPHPLQYGTIALKIGLGSPHSSGASAVFAELLDPSTTGGGVRKFQEQVRLEILVEATDAVALDLVEVEC
jgi:hypothetical protein